MKKIDIKKAVLLGLVCGNILAYGSAFAAVPDPKIWGKYTDYEYFFGDNPYDGFVTIRIWESGTDVYYPGNVEIDKNKNTVNRALLEAGSPLIASDSMVKSELESIYLGFNYYKDLLGNPVKGVPVISVCLNDKRDGNANASSMVTDENNVLGTDLSQYFTNGEAKDLKVSDFYAANINIDLAPENSQTYFGLSVLTENGVNDAHTATIVHEMMHAFGLICYSGPKNENSNVDVIFPVSEYILGLHGAYGETSFSLTDEGKIDLKDGLKEIKIVGKGDFNRDNPPADTDTSFYMLDEYRYCGNYFMPVKKDGSINTDSNVYKVLGEGTTIAWPDDSDTPAVQGIPINGIEEERKDLSHIELQNGSMSHQNYRNWGTLMEAEIALLQDIGYGNIDRGKFYGGSLYKSGTATQVNVVENPLSSSTNTYIADGTYSSSQNYAIGYHVYGSYNQVQGLGCDIALTGAGAVGMRVDGVGNDVVLNETVNLTGAKSNGVVFSYGNNHNLSVNKAVSVTGTGGIGLRFDFGDNQLSNGNEYRGSYIHGSYISGYQDEVYYDGWADWEYLSALEGPLMNKVEVNADITGSEQAIYISKNAYVRELNINTANINGNITSEWNPTGILYTAKEMGGTGADLTLNKVILNGTDPATLMTALNFNTDVDVEGNITGYNSLNMTIDEGKTVTVAGNVLVHELSSESGELYVGGGLLEYQDASEYNGNISVAEGPLLGAYEGSMIYGEWFTYAEKPNQSNKRLSNMNSSLLLGWRAQNNDLNKRMGELRLKNGEAGVWARMSRGENEGEGIKRQFNLYQVGYDHEIGSNWIGGVALSWNKGQSNTWGSTGYAKGEDETGSLGLYASRLNKDGTFVDLIVKYGRTSNDVDSYFATGMGSFDYHTPAMSASGEVGKRYQKGKWWLEPQAEFTYGFDRGAEYTTSKGLSVHQEAFKTAVGRLGLAVGMDFPGGNFYARASYLYDFEGKSDMIAQRGTQIRNYHDDMGGSWWEVGIGTNFKTGKDSYVYADVEKTYGGSMRTPWRWNLGLRWSF